mgnify:CR=1 FL=1
MFKMIPSLFQKMTGENIPASFYENADKARTQSDRSMSDSDMAMLMQMMSDSGNDSRSPLMRGGGGELNPGLQALQKSNPEVVNKILKRDMGGSISDRDKAMEDLMSYRMA